MTLGGGLANGIGIESMAMRCVSGASATAICGRSGGVATAGLVGDSMGLRGFDEIGGTLRSGHKLVVDLEPCKAVMPDELIDLELPWGGERGR